MNVHDIARKPGEVLPNGAIIIKDFETRRRREDEGLERRESIVLALNPGGSEPYVSWSRWVTFREDGEVVADDTCWGHYNTDLGRAIDQFDLRVEEVTDAGVLG